MSFFHGDDDIGDDWTTRGVPHGIGLFSGDDFLSLDNSDMPSFNRAEEGENAFYAMNENTRAAWDIFNETQEETGDNSSYGSPTFHKDGSTDPMNLTTSDRDDSDISTVSIPSSPIHHLKRHGKLHALEALEEGNLGRVLDAEDFLVAPDVTLALLPHMDAAMLLSLSVASRALCRRYGQFLKASATRRSVLSQFARTVLAEGAWALAREFPHLFAETVRGSSVYYAGVRGAVRNVYVLLDTLPVDKKHRYIRLLACGVARGGHLAHVRSMLEHMTQTMPRPEVFAILAYPIDVIVPSHATTREERERGDTRGARTLVDFLVTERNPDMGLVLELVGKGYARMTTFATRVVMAINRGNNGAGTTSSSGGTAVSYGNHLVAAYLQTLKNHVHEACEACNMEMLAHLWDNHDSNLVAFTVTEHHVALIQCVVATTNADCTRARKIETICRVLARCTYYNGVVVAKAARALGSLCLFEMAFDQTRARPSANIEYTQGQRLSTIITIATAEQSAMPPVTSSDASHIQTRLLPVPPRLAQRPVPTARPMASPQMSPITPRPAKIVRPTSAVPSAPVSKPLKSGRVHKTNAKYTSGEFIHSFPLAHK